MDEFPEIEIRRSDDVLIKLQVEVEDTINFNRSIKRMLNSNDFEMIWNSISEKSRNNFLKYYEEQNLSKIKTWLKYHRSNKKSIDDWGIRQLRPTARDLGIPYWWELSRDDLIAELKNI